MMARSTPYVSEGRLFYWRETERLWISHTIGAEAWYRWLDQPENRLFYVRDAPMTVRRESVKGKRDPYWYAYRKRGGTLAKVYLGRSDQLTPTCLAASAHQLDDKQGATG